MTEDKIRTLLQEADRDAGRPARVCVDLRAVRRRAGRRRLASLAGPMAAAAVLMVALGVWSLTVRVPETTQEQNRIVALEAQVKQLQARTDSALSLIQEVLEDERRKRRLEELEAQLAGIPDALEELQEQVDRTVFILIGRADRLHRELNQTDLAIDDYNRVIELFPNNQGAKIARQRLSQIKEKRI